MFVRDTMVCSNNNKKDILYNTERFCVSIVVKIYMDTFKYRVYVCVIQIEEKDQYKWHGFNGKCEPKNKIFFISWIIWNFSYVPLKIPPSESEVNSRQSNVEHPTKHTHTHIHLSTRSWNNSKAYFLLCSIYFLPKRKW